MERDLAALRKPLPHTTLPARSGDVRFVAVAGSLPRQRLLVTKIFGHREVVVAASVHEAS